MKSKYDGRQDCRSKPRPLKPHERAGLHRVALEYRAALRAEVAKDGKAVIAAVEPEAD